MRTPPIEIAEASGSADNKHPMECTLAVLAEYASREDTGKLNIMGLFDAIRSDTFPYAMPQFYVVVRLTAGPAEFGTKKDVQLVLLDPDGKALGKMGGKGSVPVPDVVDISGRANMEVVLRMIGVPFPKPGNYAIAVLVNGEQKHSIPIDVSQVKAKPQAGRRKRNG